MPNASLMNLSTETTQTAETSRVGAYLELTKMRISVMVLLTFAVAAVLEATVAGIPVAWSGLYWGLLGMLLVAASGNAMNMYIERYTDFLMPRTAVRPLPTYRLTSSEVAIFAAVTLGVGSAILFQLVNWQTAVCGLLNWILYSLVYTPLKRKHWINTEVGAVAGAMPILMGSLATTGSIGWLGWSFFGVLFFWQFPHFMAIAWKYRDQYRLGGLQMLTVTEPTGLAAGRKAVVTSTLLLLVSLAPALLIPSRIGSSVLLGVAIMLGIYYLLASWSFFRDRNDETARKLMLVSLLYLPLYMVALVVGSLV
jgi:protoheme IX farnesyltransferase